MSERFEMGEIVILRNDPAITWAKEIWLLEGEEIQVVAPLGDWITSAGAFRSYVVYHPSCGNFYCAPHELRRKRPPTTGEALIRAMFGAPPVDRRQPATAWMAQYDTAQALMAMGVRVRVGEWPVEGEV